MDLFNREQLRNLATTDTHPCVSLYMPAYRYEADSEQNPIRFRNLLKKAREELTDQGFKAEELDEFFRPADQLLNRSSYWHEQSDGLAAFLSEDTAQFYRLPVHFEELVTTSGRFHLKPLFPLIATNNQFYVLALSQNSVKLYQGTHFAISEIHVEEIPESITDALYFDDPEREIQHHVSNRAGERADAAFHGHGNTNSDDERGQPKSDLHRFFRRVNDGLKEYLTDESAPLLLAGVEYYLPIYKDENSYPHLIDDEIIPGNPEHMNAKELHQKAWELIEPRFLAVQEEAKEVFHSRRGNEDGLTSEDLREIIPAAMFSRIDALFVPIGAHKWGTYDPNENAVHLHDEQQSGDDDLMDFAAVYTYLNGGQVHALRRENMPVPSDVAASFRFKTDVAAETAVD